MTIFMPKYIKTIHVLYIILLFSGILCLYGIGWGRVEEWNPDQMVFYQFSNTNNILNKPNNYLKPYFVPYFYNIIVLSPIKYVLQFVHTNKIVSQTATLISLRLLHVCFFIGTQIIIFLWSKKMYGDKTALILTFLFGTSAGYMVFTHFLTADIPLCFWFTLALYLSFCLFENRNIYLWFYDGLVLGLTTSVKYNGYFAILPQIFVVVYLLYKKIFSAKKMFMLCTVMLVGVVLGFMLFNPFIIFDFQRFYSDVYYLMITDRNYSFIAGQSFVEFFYNIIEILGVPTSLLLLISILLIFFDRINRKKSNVLFYVFQMAVFLPYYVYFGLYVSLDTRYVLPIIPLLLLNLGSFLNHSKIHKTGFYVVSVIILYNMICCYYLGIRFLGDPRTQAQTWMEKTVSPGDTIENHNYSPKWGKLISNINVSFAPNISGRLERYKIWFKSDKVIQQKLSEFESADEHVDWYSKSAFEKRHPDYIAINSLGYNRFSNNQLVKLYPIVSQYYDDLLHGNTNYKLVFSATNGKFPTWIYPQKIYFLTNKQLIFKRISF
jgi:hypothetical protein